MAVLKQPIPRQIEAEIAEALRLNPSPMTARELYDSAGSVQDMQQMASLLNHMRTKGALELGPPRLPDEPGGMRGRPLQTYLLAAVAANPAARDIPSAPARNDSPACPDPVDLDDDSACQEPLDMAAPIPAAPISDGEMHQGKSADIVALAKMAGAEEDDGEACIAPDPTAAAYLIHDPEEDWDRAENSTNGDELHNAAPSVDPWLINVSAQVLGEPWPTAVSNQLRRALGRQESPTMDTDPVIRSINRMDEPRWQEGRMHAQRLRALAESAVCAAHPDVRTWLYDLSETIEDMAA